MEALGGEKRSCGCVWPGAAAGDAVLRAGGGQHGRVVVLRTWPAPAAKSMTGPALRGRMASSGVRRGAGAGRWRRLGWARRLAALLAARMGWGCNWAVAALSGGFRGAAGGAGGAQGPLLRPLWSPGELVAMGRCVWSGGRGQMATVHFARHAGGGHSLFLCASCSLQRNHGAPLTLSLFAILAEEQNAAGLITPSFKRTSPSPPADRPTVQHHRQPAAAPPHAAAARPPLTRRSPAAARAAT